MDKETFEFMEDSYFPEKILNEKINIIGVGATGSRVVFSLAKMGFKNISIWDFDKVERHNIDNQMYQVRDVGDFKAFALKRLIEESSNVKIKAHNEFFEKGEHLEGIVFLLVDTMLSRKEIWKNCLRCNKNIKLIIETRIRQQEGDIFVFDPNDETHIRRWEKTIFKNFPLLQPRLFFINPIVDVVGGLAVFHLMKWLSLKYGENIDGKFYFENEIKVTFKGSLKISISSFDTKTNNWFNGGSFLKPK